MKPMNNNIDRKCLLFVIFFISCHILNAQIDTFAQEIRVENEMLRRFEDLLDEDGGNQEEIENLLLEESENRQFEGLANLNTLSPEIAFSLLKLTDYQYYNLLAYISNYGELVSIYELVSVEGFSFEDLYRLMPLVEVKSTKVKSRFWKSFFKKSKNSFLLRYGQILEPQAGYDTNREKHYLGSPMRLAFKYQFNSQDHLLLAFSGEKDAGEEFFRGSQKQGFDFYSGYLCLKNIGILRKAVIGDYKLNFGQGLVVGSVLMSGKGGGVGSVRRFANAIQPVAPLNEGNALRGAAVELGGYRFSGTIFAGCRSYDGSVIEEEDSLRYFDGSLGGTGYHRTESELAKRKQLWSWTCGGDFLYRHRIFRLGIRAVHTQFNSEILPSDKYYQLYNFSGRGMSNLGVDYQLILKKVLLFGEAAVSGNGGWAVLQGLRFDLSPGASFAILCHYNDNQYIALQGTGNGASKGEAGFYLTSQIILSPKVDLNFYYDYNYYTWLRYRIDAPSSEMKIGSDILVAVGRQSKLQIKYQYKKKAKNQVNDLMVNGIVPFHHSCFRVSWNYMPFDFLKLKTEIDYVINHSKTIDYKHNGILLYQDIAAEVKSWGLGVNARVAFFDVDTYEERLYAYESDLYYCFTINSHFDKGFRFYVMARYAYKCFHIWLRIAQTYYLNKTEISSGLDQIEGNHKTELKLQLMIKF